MQKLVSIGIVLLLASCSNDDTTPDIINNSVYLFEDGFETSSNDLLELFPNDGSRWSNVQQVDPDGGENEIEIESAVVFEGNNSLRIYAETSDNTLSKLVQTFILHQQKT